jgi:hypothetical protein
VLEVGLRGDAEDVGRAHALLLHDEMVAEERALQDVLERLVPLAPARTALLDLARLRFRSPDALVGEPLRVEMAAAAAAFSPDPFADEIPTYARFVLLNALYDVALSFERSPLLGCSSVVLSGRRTIEGHTLLGRAFDFEAHEIFDRGKAVLLVRERGRIPLASVAWPGLLGVVTGVNAAGLALVVHGARARAPSSAGEPTLLSLREVLGSASTAEQAAAALSVRPAMVAHMVLAADASGTAIVVERAPGEPDHVRRGGETLALTNQLEGPLAFDAANVRVIEQTSSATRRARLEEMLRALDRPATPADVLAMLRDRRLPGGSRLEPGDRRAIDASIAAHGVVVDLTAREIWVSEGPHLAGRFVRFDLTELLRDGYEPDPDAPVVALPADAAR